MNRDEFIEAYALVCDAVERTYQGWPLTDEDQFVHTSAEARACALRIFEILDIHHDEQ